MMRAHRWLIFAALAMSLMARSATGADFEEKRFYVTPFLGWTIFDSERKFLTGDDLPNDLHYGGRAGVRLNRLLWIDLAGGYTPVTTCCDWVEWTHYSGNLMFSPASGRRMNPFFSVGGGLSSYKHSAGPTEKLGTLEAAGGLRVRLNNTFGLRLEARNLLAIPKGPIKSAHVDDILVGVGLNMAFGGGDREPLPVDGDSDGDGVMDSRDKCPGTQRGCVVDADGCPIDSDHDGVCDGLDQCPNTASGATVDRVGCVIAPPEPPEIKQRETELLDTGMLRISDINFDYDKSSIRPRSSRSGPGSRSRSVVTPTRGGATRTTTP
jgi:OOP family OmpA-OmpF porin